MKQSNESVRKYQIFLSKKLCVLVSVVCDCERGAVGTSEGFCVIYCQGLNGCLYVRVCGSSSFCGLKLLI